MLELLPVLRQRFFDANGNPLAGGKLYSYKAGTTTPVATYRDAFGFAANTNPIILDANGEADVWISPGAGAYKFVLEDANGVVQWTIDNIAQTSETEASTGWSLHEITDGQSATDLEGETVDFDTYSSAIYDVEIIRGTTVFASGRIAIQNVNGTARVISGGFLANEAHGVTFSVSQNGTTAQLRAALDSGAGNGTIKLSRRLIPA